MLIRLLLLASFISGSVLAMDLDESSVEIPDRVSVKGDRLMLGEIARIVPPSDGLARISIGYSPYPGHHRWLERSDVERVLERAGLSELVRLRMNERVLVTRDSQNLNSEQIRPVIEKFLASLRPDLEFRVLELELPQNIILPEGDVDISVGSPDTLTRLDGSSLRLDFTVEGKRIKSQWVRVRAVARGPVLLVKNDLDYGDRVTSSDVQLVERESNSLEQFVAGYQAVVGKSTRHTIQSGDFIVPDDVRKPNMVKRGDVVTLIARGKGVTVSALAKSRVAGTEGEFVLLENLDTKQVVRGRVIGEKLVEIDLPEVMP